MIKLIAIDLDGTLLDSELTVPQANLDMLNEAIREGVRIVICTGRPYASMRRYLEGIDYPAGAKEYLILQNGATIVEIPGERRLYEARVTRADREAAVDFMPMIADYSIDLVGFTDERYYVMGTESVNEWTQQDIDTNGMPVTYLTVEEFIAQDNLNKMMLVGEPSQLDAIDAMVRAQLGAQLDQVRSLPFIIELLLPNVNKGTSLKRLATELALEMDEVMAIGDQMNDLTMFEAAGYRVAMANAHPEVRALSDAVTLSNDEAGVAAAIIHVLKKQGYQPAD